MLARFQARDRIRIALRFVDTEISRIAAPFDIVGEHDLVDLVLGSAVGVVEVLQPDAVAAVEARYDVTATARYADQVRTGQVRELDHVHSHGRAVRLDNGVLAEALGEQMGVVAGATIEGVVACTSDQDVVARTAVEDVLVASATVEPVGQVATGDGVVAEPDHRGCCSPGSSP